MRKVFVSVLSSFLVLTLVGCSSNSASTATTSGTMKAGTYTASKQGMNDTIEVSVTVTDTEITSVEVTSHSETPGIGGELKNSEGKVMTSGGLAPVELIPEEIVSNQSVEVDNVTGATITSAAIKSAVKDALEQAGANLDDFSKEVVVDSAFEDLEADVVVAGGGGAGLAAAISAAQQGKSVIVIEKNGEIGGDTLVCGAIYNTPD